MYALVEYKGKQYKAEKDAILIQVQIKERLSPYNRT